MKQASVRVSKTLSPSDVDLIRDYVRRANNGDDRDKRRDAAFEMAGAIASMVGICCYCGVDSTDAPCCEKRARVDRWLEEWRSTRESSQGAVHDVTEVA